MPYTQKQLKQLEARLMKERERALRALARFDDDFGAGAGDAADLFAFPLHMADEGTDANQREKAFLLASEGGRHLLAIDAALRRLYRAPEAFGSCNHCGTAVGMERLDAIPWAETCIACQNQRENAE
jgi:RNA polymerase-binding transcription factor DksA